MSDAAQSPSSARSPLFSRMRGSLAATVQPNGSSAQVQSSPVPQVSEQPVQQQDLEVLDQVLSEVEQQSAALGAPQPAQQPVVEAPSPVTDETPEQVEPAVLPVAAAQAFPQAVDQATNTLNPDFAQTGGAVKERYEAGASLDQASTDAEQALGAASQIEIEPSPEISPEIEAYLQEVKQHKDQIPDEIVLADDGQVVSTKPHIAQPVIVLPINEQEEQEGSKKNPTFSFRWLVEFSHKLMKMFEGKVIYREE